MVIDSFNLVPKLVVMTKKERQGAYQWNIDLLLVRHSRWHLMECSSSIRHRFVDLGEEFVDEKLRWHRPNYDFASFGFVTFVKVFGLVRVE